MLGSSIIALVFATTPAATVVALRPSIQTSGFDLRIRDVVEVRAGRLPTHIGAQVVARLPRDIRLFEMPMEDLSALVRRRVPGLRIFGATTGIVQIRTAGEPTPASVAGACYAAAVAIPSGVALSAEDVVAASCRVNAEAAPLRYDRARLAVAAGPIPAGAYLGRLAALPERAIGKGAVLTLRSTAGPVTIERQVTAMQSGRSGKRLFVQDATGQIFAAPLVLDEEALRQ